MVTSTQVPAPRLADILPPDRNSFGLMRLAAALAVVVSHSVHLAGAPESAEPLAALTGFSLGEHAVHVFFTVSGVLIAASLVRAPNLLAFAQARALRLLPGLTACVAVTALVLGPLLSDLAAPGYFGSAQLYRYFGVTMGLITANAPLPGVFTHNRVPDLVNLPLWTLKYEAACYLGLAVLGLAGVFRAPKRLTAVLALPMLAWVIAAAVPALVAASPFAASILRLGFSFSLGTLAFVWRDRLVLHWRGLAAAGLIAAAALGTSLAAPAEQIFAGYAALWLAARPMGWAGAVTRKADLSYGVYIYDWPVAQMLVRLLPNISQPMLLAATLAVVLPVAAISWHLIEKPALTVKRFKPSLRLRPQNIIPAGL